MSRVSVVDPESVLRAREHAPGVTGGGNPRAAAGLLDEEALVALEAVALV